MKLTLEEASEVLKEELDNPDVLAISTWVPPQLGKSKPFNPAEYLKRALRNAEEIDLTKYLKSLFLYYKNDKNNF